MTRYHTLITIGADEGTKTVENEKGWQETLACLIQGTESGVCTYRYLPETYASSNGKREIDSLEIASKQWANGTDGPCEDGEADHCMPFCGRYIANYYPPCVPNPGVATFEKDQNFPEGRNRRYTTRFKDRWVEEQVTGIIDGRIDVETNQSAKNLGVDGYGRKGSKAKIRFHKNKACQDAYKRYFCWLNFPRCDEFQDSLPVCESVCENFFRVCGYEEEMWKCTNNADGFSLNIDNHIDIDGYFPGQPFKKNEYMHTSKKEPKIICTPSIKGEALGTGKLSAVITLFGLFVSLSLLLA